MQSKRKRILTMLENGTISMDEALSLLENLSDAPTDTHESKTVVVEPKVEKTTEESERAEHESEQQSERKSEPKFDQSNSDSEHESTDKEGKSTEEFLEDIRKEFTYVGDRFMQFMQTAVQKVKEFDAPFGQSTSFTHTMTSSAEGIEEIILDVDHGTIDIYTTEEKEVRAEFSVKAFNAETEEAAKENFLEKLLFITDGNKLRMSSAMKMTQVNVALYIPNHQYAKLSTRLMSGSFNMNDVQIQNVRVKTANGKIEVSGLTFEKAEFETANGKIGLKDIQGEVLEAETLNGRVYIDGNVQEVEAQSVSGHVVVTTSSEIANKIDAKSMSGSVEIYIPKNISLSGEIASNMGKLNLRLDDVDKTVEQEQLLQRSIRFKKELEKGDSPLHIFGEAKTGSVLVSYNG